ncbi:sugar phosphate nucleotidyltransferase [Candidatus Pelagibacter sp.]|nr:sugar phosphate nucleotidyltransferase [Candidatus Pelagibacter sp.]
MKIKAACILCAGFGKRLNPITFDTPKPLLKINNETVLEKCINLIESLEIKKIYLNTYHLKEQIFNFLEKKKFKSNIKIIDDGKNILNTGGGLLNMMKFSNENDFLVFNPDTIWNKYYKEEIQRMEKIYFSKKIDNILMMVNKNLSYDKSLNGDFSLRNYIISKQEPRNHIYIGCQIIKKKLLNNYEIKNFSINDVWKELVNKKKLFGYESFKDFYHLTNLETFKKLKDL